MRHHRLLLAAVVLALSATAQSALAQGLPVKPPETAAAAGSLDFARVFASPSLNGPSPRGVKLSPDGRFLTLLRNRADDRERYDLWGFDRTSGAWRMLVDSLKLGSGKPLSETEKMQRERQRIGDLKGIVAYEWAPPIAALVASPSSGNVSVNVQLNAGGSTDDGTMTYTFNFGDGSPVVGPQISATTTHTYSAGNWTATVTVTDNLGATATATAAVTVSNAPPNLVGNPGFETNLTGWSPVRTAWRWSRPASR